jgi:hypothetical protein
MTGMTCRSSCTSSMRESTSLKRTCAKCSHASPIIPLTASRNYCHGTSQRNSTQNQAALHSQLHHVKTACDRRMTLRNQVVFGPDIALSPSRRPTSKSLMAAALDQSRLA